MWVAGAPLGPTGGHGDARNGLDPQLEHPGWSDNLVDSPEAARRAVRTLKRSGADLIKIMPSGGVLSIGDDPNAQLMTDRLFAAVFVLSAIAIALFGLIGLLERRVLRWR